MPGIEGDQPLRVPDGIFLLLRDLIHERTGIFFENNREELLLQKLEPLARQKNCSSFLDYYYLLKDNSAGDWDKTWEALSVQETYFWREISQVNALVDVIVPEWFGKRTSPFRIWSAASASGEEAYSIAMALAEKGYANHPIEIYGSDASPAALEKAQAAVYRERSFRSLPLELRQKYFQKAGNEWKLSDAIKKRVKFHRANLSSSGDIAPLARAHVIFCRNVFIYFSPHAIRQTVAMIASKMPSGGCLFVGASESLLRSTSDFELKEIAGAMAYMRI